MAGEVNPLDAKTRIAYLESLIYDVASLVVTFRDKRGVYVVIPHDLWDWLTEVKNELEESNEAFHE